MTPAEVNDSRKIEVSVIVPLHDQENIVVPLCEALSEVMAFSARLGGHLRRRW